GTRSRSPGTPSVSPGRAARARARSISPSGAALTGHPGPWTSSRPPGRSQPAPSRKRWCAWPPQTSSTAQSRVVPRRIWSTRSRVWAGAAQPLPDAGEGGSVQIGQRGVALGYDGDAFQHQFLAGDDPRAGAPAARAFEAIADDPEATPAGVAPRFQRDPFDG